MKTTLLTCALVLAALPASAQFITQQRFGGTTFYNGTTQDGQPFTGTGQTFGNTTFQTFHSGNQTTNCTTTRFGGTNFTNCH